MTLLAPVAPSRGRLQPLGVDEVRLSAGFWGSRQAVNASATIPHGQAWIDRLGWVDNFSAAAQGLGTHAGMPFADSEIYKLLEAMAWESGRSGDAGLDEQASRLAQEVARAQQEDGYLSTAFGVPGRPSRYTDLEWGHELYNYGHLLQAAVARIRAGGPPGLVDIARRVADHICESFGPGGIERVGGHPVVEMALAELARATGEGRYLDQARVFVERRGRRTLADIPLGRSYFQDETPIRELDVFLGHSVRALYLAAGAVDVAIETGDDELLDTIVAQWERTISRRTYITGGMGSRHTGEAYGEDFELAPDRAYSETCAGVASVMLAWRLLLATGEARFADLIERTLYNVVATSPGDDGRSFFYANPLHQRVEGAPVDEDAESNRASTGVRAPWFTVACCPTNVARTLASLSGYVATKDDVGVQIHQYASSVISTALADGRGVGLSVETGYPDWGTVRVTVTETPGGPWRLGLRVPAWAEGATIAVSGEIRPVSPGMAEVERVFAIGDEVVLELPITARWTFPDPRIDAVRGCVAVEKGPLVMCAESIDLAPEWDLDAVLVDASSSPGEGGEVVEVAAWAMAVPDMPWSYDGDPSHPEGEEGLVQLVPYHRWGRRGPSRMRVWLPVANRRA